MTMRRFTSIFTAILCGTVLASSASLTSAQSRSTFTFPDPNFETSIEVDVQWGNITVVGDKDATVRLRVRHTGVPGTGRELSDFSDYVRVEEVGNLIRVVGRAPKPGVFESIDLIVRVPADSKLLVSITRGGEIHVENMHNLVEVQHRNGSVELEHLRGYAVVSAVNGAIHASFDAVTPGQSMSFITLNGGIDLTMPSGLEANLRLRSQKNGYVVSDFVLPESVHVFRTDPVGGNVGDSESRDDAYSKTPVSVVASVGGGGPWLIATTENGPIQLKKG